MPSVEETLRGKYPAKEHARRVAEWIVQNGGKKDGLIYLEAQKLKYNEVCEAGEALITIFPQDCKTDCHISSSFSNANKLLLTILTGQ